MSAETLSQTAAPAEQLDTPEVETQLEINAQFAEMMGSAGLALTEVVTPAIDLARESFTPVDAAPTSNFNSKL